MLSHVTQRFNKKYAKPTVYLLAYLISVICVIVLRDNYHNDASGNLLYLEIDKMANGFQFRQICASIILFMVGYCIVAVMLPFLTELSKMVLSMPMGIAIWGLSSVILLLFRIPYNRVTSFVGFAILAATLLFWHRSSFQTIRGADLLYALAAVIILANFFSTGYPRYTMTSDTHYYIYTYGRLIASVGELRIDVMGNLIETTGIMPALMSSFAVFCGFETIQVMHYILMTSLILGIVICLCRVFSNIFIQKWKTLGLTIFLVSTATAPLFLMYTLIISHSWIMVYMLFVTTLAEEYLREDDKAIRQRVISLLAIFLSWMSLCRIEAIITVVFIIVCVSYLGLSRKELTVCAFPTLLLTGIFHAESQFLLATSNIRLPYGSVFVTKSILLMIAAVMVLMVAYILLYEKIWVKKICKHLPFFSTLLLLFAAFAFCIIDLERAKNNFQAIFYNLVNINERWYYFPVFVVVMLVLAIRNKEKHGYWDMLVFGLNLIFFCMSMGRIHPLRNGWGDSFNRYLLHVVPLMLVYLVKSFWTSINVFK